MEEGVSHGICSDCLLNEMGMVLSPEKVHHAELDRANSSLKVVCAWCGKVLHQPIRHYLRNPEMDYCINCKRLFPADDAFE